VYYIIFYNFGDGLILSNPSDRKLLAYGFQ